MIIMALTFAAGTISGIILILVAATIGLVVLSGDAE
ncbi:MAG: hypothetical protein JWR51_4658 [Devosia sp.]|nr:hypothetical protein [Devosia sp.]